MSGRIKYVRAVSPGEARGLVAEVYGQVSADFGLVGEPFTAHSPSPDLLAGVWAINRETLLVGRVPRGVKESIASTVSAINRCPYCVDVHTMMAHAVGYQPRAHDRAADQRLAAVVRWAAATRSPGADILRTPPFSAADAPEIIGVAIAFHYINRIVSAMLPETLLGGPAWLRGAVTRTAAPLLAGLLPRHVAPGASLALLPSAPLPPEFAWANASSTVAGAFARFAAVVERAEAVLPEEARRVAAERLQSWDGSDPGLSRYWVEDETHGLNGEARAAARLALLAALAPHQIDGDVVAAFRAYRPDDRSLVAALAWGSFLAARRIASWLTPFRPSPEPTGLPNSIAAPAGPDGEWAMVGEPLRRAGAGARGEG